MEELERRGEVLDRVQGLIQAQGLDEELEVARGTEEGHASAALAQLLGALDDDRQARGADVVELGDVEQEPVHVLVGLGDDGLDALGKVAWLNALEKLQAFESDSTLEARKRLRESWGRRGGLKVETR